MYIIALEAQGNGARQPLQRWHNPTAPKGFALCPDAFYDVFYSTNPAGFVHITVEDNTVTAMTVNQAALDAYIAANPPQPEEEPDPTADEILDALLGVTVHE